MSRWLTRLGDTERFAISLAFEHDPDRGDGATKELSESWGAFEIWVEGKNLCAHEEMGERLDAVHWYLLPLLEWWVEHWDPLLHEQRMPRQEIAGIDAWTAFHHHDWPPPHLDESAQDDWLADWQAWRSRHSVQAARDGGLFPDIFFRRLGHEIELSWGPGPVAGAPDHYRFLHAAGAARLAPEEVAEPVAEALAAAITKLRAWLPESARLKKLQKAHASLSSHSPARLAWLAGLTKNQWSSFTKKARSKFADAQEAVESIFDHGTSPLVVTGSCQAALMFGTLSPTLEEADLLSVAEEQILSFENPATEADLLQQLISSAPFGPEPAFQQGYRLAEQALTGLDLESGSEPIEIETILEDLGIRIGELSFADEAIRGMAFVSSAHRPTILINKSHPANGYHSGRRFTLAHELCHLLHDRTQGRGLALASGPWTSLGIEQRANAFAAMLLMPSSTLNRLLGPQNQKLSRQDVLRLAKQLKCGFVATLEHLTNLGYLSPAERQAIDAQIDQSAE